MSVLTLALDGFTMGPDGLHCEYVPGSRVCGPFRIIGEIAASEGNAGFLVKGMEHGARPFLVERAWSHEGRRVAMELARRGILVRPDGRVHSALNEFFALATVDPPQ